MECLRLVSPTDSDSESLGSATLSFVLNFLLGGADMIIVDEKDKFCQDNKLYKFNTTTQCDLLCRYYVYVSFWSFRLIGRRRQAIHESGSYNGLHRPNFNETNIRRENLKT